SSEKQLRKLSEFLSHPGLRLPSRASARSCRFPKIDGARLVFGDAADRIEGHRASSLANDLCGRDSRLGRVQLEWTAQKKPKLKRNHGGGEGRSNQSCQFLRPGFALRFG